MLAISRSNKVSKNAPGDLVTRCEDRHPEEHNQQAHTGKHGEDPGGAVWDALADQGRRRARS